MDRSGPFPVSSKLLALLAVPALLMTAAPAPGHQPPTDLKLVGDHWTAWDPPTTFPEGAEVYIIVRGDTLWDLAARFYGDPYLWPQLWEQNQYIRDAHWIYPGDPLVVGFEVTPLEDLATLQDAVEDGDSDFDRSIGAPEALGSEADIYCSGFIAPEGRGFTHTIVGSEYQNLGPSLARSRGTRRGRFASSAPTAKVGLSAGDIVYLDGGAGSGLAPGQTLVSVVPRRQVRHPVSGERLGTYYEYLGRVQVLSVQEDGAIAEVSYSCRPMEIGSRLEPFVPEPIPLRRRTPLRGVNDPVTREALEGAPVIVHTTDQVVTLGASSVVLIDRGAADDVAPGDLFTIYRLGPTGTPPMVLGELAVLSVHETSSVGRILESRYAVYVGDLLDLK